MATRPSTLPTWATTGGTRVSPSGAKRNAGFAAREAIPYTLANALFGEAGDWVEYLDEAISDLEADAIRAPAATESVTALDVDRLFVVSPSGGPSASLGAATVAIAADGEYVWAATATNLFRLRASDLSGGGSAHWTAPSGTIVDVACSGGHVYVAIGSTVYVVDRSTASTTLGSRDVGSTVTAIATPGHCIFVARGDLVERWDFAGAPTYIEVAANWSYDHGDTINDICALPSGSTTAAVAVAADSAGSGPAAGFGGVVLVDDSLDYTIAAIAVSGLSCTAVGSNGLRVVWGVRNGDSDGELKLGGLYGIRSVSPAMATVTSQVLTDLTTNEDITDVVVTERLIIARDSGGVVSLVNFEGKVVGRDAAGAGIAADCRSGLGQVSNVVFRIYDSYVSRIVQRVAHDNPARTPYHQLLVPLGGS